MKNAFLKNRIYEMMEKLKNILDMYFARYDKEISESRDGSTSINIAIELNEILKRNIVTIAFGEDVSQTEIPFHHFTD